MPRSSDANGSTARSSTAVPRSANPKYGVGFDNVDEPALRPARVALGTGGVNRRSVSELCSARCWVSYATSCRA